jgi:hypothetical protein
MKRNGVTLVILVSLAIGVVAFHAGAGTTDRGRTLEQRVTTLEASADRQRRAIDDLRADNRQQQRLIARLLRFRADANDELARYERRTSRLNGQGVYDGPVDNGQLQLGGDPASCEGRVAEWNAVGTSLGCVPATP